MVLGTCIGTIVLQYEITNRNIHHIYLDVQLFDQWVFFLLVITSVLHHDQVSLGPNIDPMVIVDKPIILWWTTYGGKSDEEITCGNVQCRVSVDRSLQFQNDVQVIDKWLISILRFWEKKIVFYETVINEDIIILTKINKGVCIITQ